jgi:hypothetical protein
MYVDEVGNATLKQVEHPDNQYLSLTGVIFDTEYARCVLTPRLEEMKHCYFASHPDDPVIFHRYKLIKALPPFQALLTPERRSAFGSDILALARDLEYTAVTAIVDKAEMLRRYTVWQEDPYHYAMEILLERYVLWLKGKHATGDVFAEERGKKEDGRLAEAFGDLVSRGTGYVKACASHLANHAITFRPKRANVAGLQIADMLAQPSYQDFKMRRLNLPPLTGLTAQLAAVLNASKYRRSSSGVIDGYGRKWLP